MTKTYKELRQELDQIEKIENPWERALRSTIIEVESLIITEEDEIKEDLKRIKEYAADKLGDDAGYLESLLRRHRDATDRRDQLRGKLRLLEHIASQAESGKG